MKRGADIAFLFQKHAAKKASTAVISSQVKNVAEEHNQEQPSIIEEVVNHTPPPPPPPLSVYDISRLPHDPGERQPIQSYSVNNLHGTLSLFYAYLRLSVWCV
jgi:hypothetical protein